MTASSGARFHVGPSQGSEGYELSELRFDCIERDFGLFLFDFTLDRCEVFLRFLESVTIVAERAECLLDKLTVDLGGSGARLVAEVSEKTASATAERKAGKDYDEYRTIRGVTTGFHRAFSGYLRAHKAGSDS